MVLSSGLVCLYGPDDAVVEDKGLGDREDTPEDDQQCQVLDPGKLEQLPESGQVREQWVKSTTGGGGSGLVKYITSRVSERRGRERRACEGRGYKGWGVRGRGVRGESARGGGVRDVRGGDMRAGGSEGI